MTLFRNTAPTNVSLVPTTFSTGEQTVVVPVSPQTWINPGILDSRGDIVVTLIADFTPAEVVASRRSVTTFHSTLYEAFGFRADPVYNYFVEDETSNQNQNENVPARDLPRYVELFWKPAPLRQVRESARPGIRPIDPRQLELVQSVVDVKTAAGSIANGYIAPGVISGLLIQPVTLQQSATFNEDQFLTSPTAGGLDAMSFATLDSSAFHTDPLPSAIETVRVNFIDPSIAGALDSNRLNVAGDEMQLIVAGSLSKILPGLEVISEFNQDTPSQNPPPTFTGPADVPALAYVGYVIERHDLGPSGSLSLAKTFYIDDPGQKRLVDRSVVFGGRYRYRIKSVVQWAHQSTVGFYGESRLVRSPAFDPAGGSVTTEVSYYGGDWSDWASADIIDAVPPEPPDELTVRPVSRHGYIDVVWKMPNDPQRDTHRVRLLRCVERDGRIGPWVQLGEFPAANGRFVDRSVSSFTQEQTKYTYAMYSLTRHGERSVLSEQVEARLEEVSAMHELPLVQIAPKGSDAMADSYAARTPIRDWNIIGKSRAVFYVRTAESAHPLNDRTYTVEVQSISTGEKARVTLSVDSTDVIPGTTSQGRSVNPTNAALVTTSRGRLS